MMHLSLKRHRYLPWQYGRPQRREELARDVQLRLAVAAAEEVRARGEGPSRADRAEAGGRRQDERRGDEASHHSGFFL